MTVQTKRESKTGSPAENAANAGEIADDEPHDPDSESSKTRPNPQDFSEQEESSHDADSVPQDDLEDELEPWVGYRVGVNHQADDMLAPSGMTSWILRQSRMYWKLARMIAKHNDSRWTKL